jgi:hypothetical protein
MNYTNFADLDLVTPPTRPEHLPTPTHTPVLTRILPVTRRLSFSSLLNESLTVDINDTHGENINDTTLEYAEATLYEPGHQPLMHLIAIDAAFRAILQRDVISNFEFLENWREAHRRQFGAGRYPECGWFRVGLNEVIIAYSLQWVGYYERYLTLDYHTYNLLVGQPGFRTTDTGYEFAVAFGRFEFRGMEHQREPLRLPTIQREPLRLPIVDRELVPIATQLETLHSSNLDSELPSIDVSFIEQLDQSPVSAEGSSNSLLTSPPASVPCALPALVHIYVDADSFLQLPSYQISNYDSEHLYGMFQKHREFFGMGEMDFLSFVQAVGYRKLSSDEEKSFIVYHTSSDGDMCLTLDSDANNKVTLYGHPRRPVRVRRDAALAASLRIFQIFYN